VAWCPYTHGKFSMTAGLLPKNSDLRYGINGFVFDGHQLSHFFERSVTSSITSIEKRVMAQRTRSMKNGSG
jgi:hypothetical protein